MNEHRYRRLLWLYPKEYREKRGAEIVGTLLEAAESGRARPAHREVAALVVGALRARTGVAALGSPGRLWRSGLRAAVLLLVTHAAAQSLARAGRVVFSDLPGRGLALDSDLGHPIALVAYACALVAFAAGRYPTGIALAGAGFAAAEWAASWLPLQVQLVIGEFWPVPLAIALALPLLRRRPPAARRPFAWLLAIPLAVVLLPTAFDASLRLQPFTLLAVCLGGLVWSLVDARAAIATGALMLGPILTFLGYYLPGWGNGRAETLALLVTFAVSAAVLLGAGAVLGRRQAAP